MILAWILGLSLIACSDKDTSGDTSKPVDDTSETGDSDSDSGDANCPDGPGVVDGVLVGSDNVPLNTGAVRLYDSTGSEEKVSDNVDGDGLYHLVFGKGEYVVRGEYGTCVGEDLPVTICGEQTVYKTIQLSCAP